MIVIFLSVFSVVVVVMLWVMYKKYNINLNEPLNLTDIEKL
jgi:hypothetical protein